MPLVKNEWGDKIFWIIIAISPSLLPGEGKSGIQGIQKILATSLRLIQKRKVIHTPVHKLITERKNNLSRVTFQKNEKK